MKKITIYILFSLFIFTPHLASAKSFKVLAPTEGDEYYFGDTIIMEWSPEETGVSTILLKSSKKRSESFQLYGMKGGGDPTNYSGYYDYKLPNYLLYTPGEYFIEFILENGKKVKSKKFTIINQNSSGIQSAEANYSLGEANGLLKSYKRGEPITFTIDGYEQPKIEATSQNGFNIQSYIYFKNKKNRALQGVNARYDYQLQNWVTEMIAPKNKGNYEAEVVLYCGDVGLTSYCANKYPNSEQIVKRFPFKVTK